MPSTPSLVTPSFPSFSFWPFRLPLRHRRHRCRRLPPRSASSSFSWKSRFPTPRHQTVGPACCVLHIKAEGTKTVNCCLLLLLFFHEKYVENISRRRKKSSQLTGDFVHFRFIPFRSVCMNSTRNKNMPSNFMETVILLSLLSLLLTSPLLKNDAYTFGCRLVSTTKKTVGEKKETESIPKTCLRFDGNRAQVVAVAPSLHSRCRFLLFCRRFPVGFRPLHGVLRQVHRAQ